MLNIARSTLPPSHSHSDAAHKKHDRNKTGAHIVAWQSGHFTLFLYMCNLMTWGRVYIIHIVLFSHVSNSSGMFWFSDCQLQNLDLNIGPWIASGCGSLQAIMQHCWPFSSLGKMDVSGPHVKWQMLQSGFIWLVLGWTGALNDWQNKACSFVLMADSFVFWSCAVFHMKWVQEHERTNNRFWDFGIFLWKEKKTKLGRFVLSMPCYVL